MCCLHSGVWAERRGRGWTPKLLCCIQYYCWNPKATQITCSSLMSGEECGQGCPPPRMYSWSQSNKWESIILVQGGQPIIGNYNTLTTLSLFWGMVCCIPLALSFWFSTHKPEPSPWGIWGLSTKNRYYKWSGGSLALQIWSTNCNLWNSYHGNVTYDSGKLGTEISSNRGVVNEQWFIHARGFYTTIKINTLQLSIKLEETLKHNDWWKRQI